MFAGIESCCCFACWCKGMQDEASCIFLVIITYWVSHSELSSPSPWAFIFFFLALFLPQLYMFGLTQAIFLFPLVFIAFMQWCRVIHIRTTQVLEKVWLSFQLVTFWDLNIFIRKVMKNALAFCSHPVIYLRSPDYLDHIQLRMGHALRKYLGTGAWTGPWN